MSDGERSTVFFPGAGSFGGEFRPLTEALGPAAWLVRYPGRAGRDFGTPAASFDAVVRACVEQIARRPGPRPVLFGHSYGAYVAYATTLALSGEGLEAAALVVAGAAAPGLLRVPQEAARSPEAAAEYLADVSPDLLAETPSQEWWSVVAETAAQDLRLLDEFAAAEPGGVGPVRCPVLAVRGVNDPLTTDATIAAWRHATEGPFARRTVSGGHTEPLRSLDVAAWLRQARADADAAGGT